MMFRPGTVPATPMSADELRDLRAKHGLSRAAVARMLGLSESTVFRWETGESATPPLLRPALHYYLERSKA